MPDVGFDLPSLGYTFGMKAALLIIDMQQDFFEKPALRALQPALVEHINQLVGVARSHAVPIIWVRQEVKADGSNAVIGDRKLGKWNVIEGTEGAKLLDDFVIEPGDLEVIKTRYSSFYKTDLEDKLAKLGTDTLIIAGINTHACVRMVAIDAYQRDYEVILALDCIGSWDEEHHRVTVKYLTGKITQPMTNSEIEKALS